MAAEKSRDEQLRDEFAAGGNPESPAVLKARIDQLERRLDVVERRTNTNV